MTRRFEATRGCAFFRLPPLPRGGRGGSETHWPRPYRRNPPVSPIGKGGRLFSGITTSIVAVCLLAFASAVDLRAPAQDVDPPGVEILTAAPFDRITLTDRTVLNIEPISPRPLPEIDPDKEAKARRKKAEPPPRQGNIGLPGERSMVKAAPTEAEEEEANQVVIHLLEGEVRDFKVARSSVQQVVYYEDMLLAACDRLSLARDFGRAFECCLRVQARDPKWPGLDGHVDKLLFAEGSAALLDGEGERGLRLLRELFARKPEFPGLADKLAESYGSRSTRAFDLGLYALGRKVLHDVEQLAPTHPIVRAVRSRFTSRAKERLDASKTLAGSAKLDALADALRVWPTTEGADAAYREAFAAWPTVDVAVTDVPRALGPWVRSPADERVTRLVYLPVLAVDDEEAAKGKAEGQLAAEVKTADLGRRIVVSLRPDVRWSDGSRPVAPVDLARALTDAAEPTSLRYNARWADLLERVDTSDESRVEIRLTRPVIKPGSWLLGPVGPAHGGSDGLVATAAGGRDLVGDGPFLWSPLGPGRAELVARRVGAKVRRIRETRYADAASAIGAFNRGEVAVLEHVPADRVAALAADPDVKVGTYARPSLHRIALDGRNPVLRNRSLRRALSTAIDRRTLLEETLLKRPPDAANAVSDGVFAKGSYADAPDVRPLGYNPVLAKMLVAAARKELADAPVTLTFEYPARPEAQAVAAKIVEALHLAGVTVNPVERPESELESDLRSGRPFDLAYRVGRCDEPVLDAGPFVSPAYDAPASTNPLAALASPEILQLLLRLERAPEFPTAKGLAVQIDRECRDELPIIPLWQLEDHYAWRTRLKGPAESAEQLYQNVPNWEVEPWFAKDPW